MVEKRVKVCDHCDRGRERETDDQCDICGKDICHCHKVSLTVEICSEDHYDFVEELNNLFLKYGIPREARFFRPGLVTRERGEFKE